MGPNPSAILACASCLAAAFSVGVRGMILSPANQTWPDAPKPIRVIMFVFMLTLTFRGVTMLSHLDEALPWEASTAAMMLAVYQGAMLLNVIRQNYPARIWRTLKRIQRIASCPQPVRDQQSAPAFYGSNISPMRTRR